MSWLNQERLFLYPCAVLFIYIFLGFFLIIRPGFLENLSEPVGTDFVAYWTASKMALAGKSAAIYDASSLLAVEKTVVQVGDSPVRWFYPPTFLLLVLPLSLMPYLVALLAWTGVTLCGYLLVIRRIAPHRLTILLTLAFPGAFQNYFYGQNAFLFTLLLGAGVLCLDSAPLAGGLLLGALIFKPQLAVLIPVALMAGRRWQALLGAVASAAALTLASYWVFGPEVWVAFLKNADLPLKLVESGNFQEYKMTTTLVAARLLGANPLTARLLQGLVMAGTAAAVAWVWSRPGAPLSIQGSILVLGILLFTPFCHDYDLALLALPLAWLGWDVYTRGWLPGEDYLLVIGWLLPIAAPMLSVTSGFEISPLVLALLVFLAVRRVKKLS